MKSMKATSVIVALLITVLLPGGCAKHQLANTNSANSAQGCSSDSETASSVMPPEEIVKPWKGDFAGMAEDTALRSFGGGPTCWVTTPTGGPEGCGLRVVVTALFPKK